MMINVELNQFLVQSFPELRTAYEEEVSWQEGDETGSHVVFGDVFTPYLKQILKNRDKVKMSSAFDFIEAVLEKNNKYCDEVIAFSVLEGILDEFGNVDFLTSYMGKRTKTVFDEVREAMNL